MTSLKDAGAPGPLTVFVLEEERTPVAADRPVRHDGDAVRDGLGLLHAVGGEQHGAPRPHAPQQRPRLPPRGRVQPRRRLVQDQELRVDTGERVKTCGDKVGGQSAAAQYVITARDLHPETTPAGH